VLDGLVMRLVLRGRLRRRRWRRRLRGVRLVNGGADRVGLGWRPELAAGILAHLERIDVLEVIAEDCFAAPPAVLDGLRALARRRPVFLHGVGLGAASTSPVAEAPLESLARALGAVEPEGWSEHLAFVRAGGVEIGHLAAPPRTAATVAGAAENFARAAARTGARPLVENVASLIDPPGSAMDEGAWLVEILRVTGCDLLLDLHNLHANAVNFGFDARAVIARLPPDRIGAVHLAGGRRLAGRVLDDHLHAVPAAVYELLALVGEHAARPLTVILERDGRYPPLTELLDELDQARAALARGRRARAHAAQAGDAQTHRAEARP
jgi:uncharacterized protein (UPF0276 family)